MHSCPQFARYWREGEMERKDHSNFPTGLDLLHLPLKPTPSSSPSALFLGTLTSGLHILVPLSSCFSKGGTPVNREVSEGRGVALPASSLLGLLRLVVSLTKGHSSHQQFLQHWGLAGGMVAGMLDFHMTNSDLSPEPGSLCSLSSVSLWWVQVPYYKLEIIINKINNFKKLIPPTPLACALSFLQISTYGTCTYGTDPFHVKLQWFCSSWGIIIPGILQTFLWFHYTQLTPAGKETSFQQAQEYKLSVKK